MKSLEIFSGAGGMACGLEEAGFEHAALVEFNRNACVSLRKNFDPEKVFEGDIRDFDPASLGEVEIVAGGPPCQPFSLGGKHKSHDDHRDMFPYAIKAIETLHPKAFVFENVKGLLRKSFADYFENIILRLTYPGHPAAAGDWRDCLKTLRKVNEWDGVKYVVKRALLNAADYGVPQTRERVVIVGVRADLGLEWSFPEPTHSRERLLWEQHVSGEYWKRHGMRPTVGSLDGRDVKAAAAALRHKFGMFEPDGLPWLTARDALADLPDPRGHHDLPDHLFIDGARTYPGHTGSHIDWPSKTIKAGGHGVPGGENMLRFEDGTVRYLTIREAKRIQTFPDDFAVTGAWGEALRQIGNAVPVRLARIIGDRLVGTLAAAGTRQVRGRQASRS
ncbi:MAG: DNA cytosine methyltransferase [Magnetococcus sp. WYHC-3]